MPESKHRRGGQSRSRRPSPPRNAPRMRPSQPVARSLQTAGKALVNSDRRRTLGKVLIGLGAVVFIQHLVRHMGFFTLFSGGFDDLLIGYPMAALLVLAGAFMVSKGEKGLRRR